MCKSFVDEMRKESKISMFGEIKFFIGLQFKKVKGGIYITWSKCIKEILQTFGMEYLRPVGTSMVTRCKLSKEDNSIGVNKILYRSMIGKLKKVHSRPDIAHEIGNAAIISTNPKKKK